MTRARDILNAIRIGLQHGLIRSPDLEFLYSDGPKRVPLLQLVEEAIAELSAPAGDASSGPDEQASSSPTGEVPQTELQKIAAQRAKNGEPWGYLDEETGFLLTFRTEEQRDYSYGQNYSRLVNPVRYGPPVAAGEVPEPTEPQRNGDTK